MTTRRHASEDERGAPPARAQQRDLLALIAAGFYLGFMVLALVRGSR